MVTSYFTLRALAAEWAPELTGCVVGDAFSQARDELTLALAAPEATWTLRLSTRGTFHYLFRTEGYSRPRRNVATLFEDALDRRVAGVRIADRDRLLYLDLDGGLRFTIALFGPRANVFLTGPDGLVSEAFQSDADATGQPEPVPRAAPLVLTPDDLRARWDRRRRTTEQAAAAAFPLFDRTLAAEALFRAGITAARPSDCTDDDLAALLAAARGLEEELARPSPRVYWRGRFADLFSLVALEHRAGAAEEPFETVDAAARVYVRRRLAEEHFRATYEPLEAALSAAAARARGRAARMLDELARGSRADQYERWGHLLMASPGAVPSGAEEVTLPDLFAEGVPVDIPLDPALGGIENARRYYDKARQTRQARAHAEERLVDTDAAAAEAEALLEALRAIRERAELEAFVKREAARLTRFAGEAAGDGDRVPFRRYPLSEGYEVWVGRNARQNDELTFRHARKHDLWMHARGVSGSHTVLRLPHRNARPGRSLLERAAAIAAYHSKARGSSLVPVMVTPRKYVRKPKGAPPGAVVAEREEVLMVAPALPE